MKKKSIGKQFELMKDSPEKHIRLDKWLKIARIFKTRTQANHACEENLVKVNGVIAKSARIIKAGDKVTVKASNRYRELEVLGISFKSIPAKEARELYREERNQIISDESLELMRLIKQAKLPGPSKYPGRPSKKERRQLIKIRGF
jgi:ribosome-associated heat shock protein Hsp15